ncbi:MAG: hypothetical protein ACLR8Y_00405 [Alistipes indistinctus]
MVSGGPLISSDIPPFVTAAHNPLSSASGINSIGLRGAASFAQRADRADPGDVPHLVPTGVLLRMECELVEKEMPQGPERGI